MSKFKDIRLKIKNVFSNRSKQWDTQLTFIEDLAKANDIEFDRTKFRRPHRKLRNFKLVWPQSAAADYIAQKLYEKRLEDPDFFRPWAASWLPLDRSRYEEAPYFYVPILELPDSTFKEPGKLRVFIFSSKPDQDGWLREDTHFRLVPICKTCRHRWNHYPPFKIKTGAYQNPQDTIEVTLEDGSVVKRLVCPVCHSTDIYKYGHIWMEETFNLERFVAAQENVYPSALAEILKGRKSGHWIWYIFPQLLGLGYSRLSHFYGISGIDEAREYLHHPLLGSRLREISTALLNLNDKSIKDVFPAVDVLKLKSSMTLFDAVEPGDVFGDVLEKYFGGERDKVTRERVEYEL